MTGKGDWVVCQLGAREHYAIPRALHDSGRLDWLLTDAWVPPGNLWGMVRRNLRERHHKALPGQSVRAFTAGAIGFEGIARLRGWHGWEGVLRRNQWFQEQVLSWLEDKSSRVAGGFEQGTLFSFSYTAREPFRWAKRNGWKTILGQIDGAIGDEHHIAKVYQRHEAGNFRPAPKTYWEQWREECDMADTVLVNSEWARTLLMRAGVPGNKIVTVPLAYSPPLESLSFVRNYPDAFDETRPLRILFLGQVSLRKGALDLLNAARLLSGRPAEFWMVGPEISPVPPHLRKLDNVRWVGAVPRGRAADYYRDADVFLFPTHSDGFGLTQLEAQAWKLPIIASPHCGRVVESGINGWELPKVGPNEIAAAVEMCLEDPTLLAQWSRQADDLAGFSLEALALRLNSL